MNLPHIRLIGGLALLLVALSGCAPATVAPAPTSAPTSAPAATTAPAPTSAPTAAPTSAPAATTAPAPTSAPAATTAPAPTVAPAPTAAPAGDEAGAVQTILDYYDAIGQQRYDQAYRLWAQDGAASGQTAAAFAQGFATTAGVSVLLGRASRDGGQVRVPITILTVENQADQSQQARRFDGDYTLAPTADGWRISGASIAPADAAPPLADIADGLSVVRAYYAAISDQNYARAYTLWAQNGAASDQSYAAFAQGFADTARVDLAVGDLQTSGAAGSIYAQLPVVIFAQQRDGSTQAFCGTYTLRRANVPPFDSLGWRIMSAGILPIADVAPGSDSVQQLLGGQCAAR